MKRLAIVVLLCPLLLATDFDDGFDSCSSRESQIDETNLLQVDKTLRQRNLGNARTGHLTNRTMQTPQALTTSPQQVVVTTTPGPSGGSVVIGQRAQAAHASQATIPITTKAPKEITASLTASPSTTIVPPIATTTEPRPPWQTQSWPDGNGRGITSTPTATLASVEEDFLPKSMGMLQVQQVPATVTGTPLPRRAGVLTTTTTPAPRSVLDGATTTTTPSPRRVNVVMPTKGPAPPKPGELRVNETAQEWAAEYATRPKPPPATTTTPNPFQVSADEAAAKAMVEHIAAQLTAFNREREAAAKVAVWMAAAAASNATAAASAAERDTVKKGLDAVHKTAVAAKAAFASTPQPSANNLPALALPLPPGAAGTPGQGSPQPLMAR